MVWRGIEAPPELEGVRVRSIDGGPKFIDIEQGGEQGRLFFRSEDESRRDEGESQREGFPQPQDTSLDI